MTGKLVEANLSRDQQIVLLSQLNNSRSKHLPAANQKFFAFLSHYSILTLTSAHHGHLPQPTSKKCSGTWLVSFSPKAKTSAASGADALRFVFDDEIEDDILRNFFTRNQGVDDDNGSTSAAQQPSATLGTTSLGSKPLVVVVMWNFKTKIQRHHLLALPAREPSPVQWIYGQQGGY